MNLTQKRLLEQAKVEIATVEKYLKLGYKPIAIRGSHIDSAITLAGKELGEDRLSFRDRLGRPNINGNWFKRFGIKPDWDLYKEPAKSPFAIDFVPSPSYVEGKSLVITSRKDNTFCFGAAGDLHAASKYTRWEVRQQLYDDFSTANVQASFDTGNWIDGEANFNRYDLEVHGLDRQCKLLAERHPKSTFPTYAVWGDDHEGWYVQREGIDVGKYAQNIMQTAGHKWYDLGFMESHVVLKNYNTGKEASLSVVHPGGGSAYALSYSIQKIIESYEGGEKPNVALYGHYHKIWAGLIRNVWVVQTGTQQDQTPFMRKKRLEAHVGGALINLKQDPRTGAILEMTPTLKRYFNKEYYSGAGRWSKHGSITPLPRLEKKVKKKKVKRRRL